MAYIASWISESRNSKTADIIVEDTLRRLMQREGPLDRFFPMKMYDSFDFLGYVVERIRTVASVVSFGAEIPLTSQGKFQKLTGDLFKIGIGREYDEKKQIEMQKAMEEAQLKGITVQNQVMPNGMVMRGANSSLADYIFGNIADVTSELNDLGYLLCMQAVQFGVVNYVDSRTGVIISLDYRSADADYGYAPYGKMAHFPPDLTATSAAWDQLSTANGLQNLEHDVETFIDTNGFPPHAIMMSRKLRRNLADQESTRRAVAMISNTAAGVLTDNVGQVSYDMLNTLLQRRELPPIIINEERYHVENSNKSVEKRRFLNDDRYVFLTEGMGEHAIGPTLEGDMAQGPYIVTREITKFPPKDATQGVATMLPVVPNPKLLFSRRVA